MSSYSFSVLWMLRCLFNISCLTFCLPAILVWILFFYRLLRYLALNSHCSVFDWDWDMTFWSYCFWNTNSLQRAWRWISVQIIAQLFCFSFFVSFYFFRIRIKNLLNLSSIWSEEKRYLSAMLLCSRWSPWDLNDIKLIFEVCIYPVVLKKKR